MATMGVSSLGVMFGYATGTEAPSAFTQLTRISSIGEINLDQEQIDVSALEDFISAYVEGRSDTGGSCDIVFLATNDTIKEWEDAITAYKGLEGDNDMYFLVYHPKLTKSFCFRAGLPAKLNMPAMEQNSAVTMTVSLTIHEYIGLVEGKTVTPKE